VASTPGGISSDFGVQKGLQRDAIKTASDALRSKTDVLRDQAIQLANQGRVQARDVLDGLSGIEQNPKLRDIPLVQKALQFVREKVGGMTDASGVVDAERLYTVRKLLNNQIGLLAKETNTWDKKLTSGVEADIKKGIDWAINNSINRTQGLGPQFQVPPAAQGVGAPQSMWDQYLNEFSSGTQAIKDTLTRQKMMYKPEQTTSLGSRDIVSGAKPHILPNWLEKPVTGFHWLQDLFAKRMEPKVDQYISELMRNPDKLASALEETQARELARKRIVEMMVQGLSPAAVGGASNFSK
jgi:hypothetical protein